MRTETLTDWTTGFFTEGEDRVEIQISYEYDLYSTGGSFYEAPSSEMENIKIEEVEFLDLETFKDLSDEEFEALKKEWKEIVESEDWIKNSLAELEDIILG